MTQQEFNNTGFKKDMKLKHIRTKEIMPIIGVDFAEKSIMCRYDSKNDYCAWFHFSEIEIVKD